MLKNVGQEILDMLLILATEMSLDEILFDKQAPNLIAAAERKRLKASLTSGPGRDKFNQIETFSNFESLQEHIFELADLDCCSIRLKSDKKRDKEYTQEFINKQKEVFESALPHDKLYICAIMSYYNLTKCLIWTSGKCIRGVISFLSRISSSNPKMDDIIDQFGICQDLVIEHLRQNGAQKETEELGENLEKLFTKINETSVNISPTLQRRMSRQASRKKESESESFDDFVKPEIKEEVVVKKADSENEKSENEEEEEEVVVEKKRSAKSRRRRAD